VNEVDRDDKLQIEELMAFLNQWNGQEVQIIKEEDGDMDLTVMTLNQTSLIERTPTIDGYVSPLSLRMEGNGYVVHENNHLEELPLATFDIPVDSLREDHFDGTRLTLLTDRGTYTISKR
jgi:hypothetical protein